MRANARRNVILVSLVAAVAAVSLLAGLASAGEGLSALGPTQLTQVPRNPHSTGIPPVAYDREQVDLFGSAKPAWQNYTFRGVTFEFHLWCAVTPASGLLCGHATEASGVEYSYQFSDGPPSALPQWQNWISPDQREGVSYLTGGTADLLVAA